MTKGYKATYNYKCKNQTYEVGQEYKMDELPIVCERGFHYCKEAISTLIYYPIKPTFKLLEIENLSKDVQKSGDKFCSNHIKIIREITDPDELNTLLKRKFTYDENTRTLKVINNNGFSCTETYSESGMLLSYKNSNELSYEYTYNENGNVLTYKDSSGFSYEYTYDKFGNELIYKDSRGSWTEYVRDEFGNQIMFKTSATVDESN